MDSPKTTPAEPIKGALELVCAKCRRFERFTGDTKAVAAIRAQAAGWVYRMAGGELCPKHAGDNYCAAVSS